jgi:hypothetical protein
MMIYQLYKTLIASLLLVFLCASLIQAQDIKEDYIGFGVIGEYSNDVRIYPLAGFVWERKFTSRSGLETGMYYRSERFELFLNVSQSGSGGFSELVSIREHYLSFPILYRYYLPKYTLSLGPVIDVYVGWDQLKKDRVTVDAFSRSPNFDLGPLLKVSRQWAITEKLFLEPEIRFGALIRTSTLFFGIGVQLKEKIR